MGDGITNNSMLVSMGDGITNNSMLFPWIIKEQTIQCQPTCQIQHRDFRFSETTLVIVTMFLTGLNVLWIGHSVPP